MKYKISVTALLVIVIGITIFGYSHYNDKISNLNDTIRENKYQINSLKYSLKLVTTKPPSLEVSEYNLSLPIHEDDFMEYSSPFGVREIPKGIYTGGAPERWHNGLDMYGLWKARIVASADGIIKDKWFVPDVRKGRKGHPIFGGYIVIQHDNGLETHYGHLSWISEDLHEGDVVKQGDVIGRQGSSGSSDGEHLHFGVSVDGEYKNPLKYIKVEENSGN